MNYIKEALDNLIRRNASSLDAYLLEVCKNEYVDSTNSDYGDGANPVILKSEFILSLCEQIIGMLVVLDSILNRITQNVDDLLQRHTARTMLANSEFIIMLNQASTDRIELAKLGEA